MKTMKHLLGTALAAALIILSANGLHAQLKVASDGNVGINEAAPSEKLHIADQALSTPGFLVDAQSGSNTVNFVKALCGSGGSGFFFRNTAFMAISPATNSAATSTNFPNSLIIRGSGDVGVGVQVPQEKLDVAGNIRTSGMLITSDKRLKTNVNKFERGLEAVLELKPISYNYTGEVGTVADERYVGVYAQNLQDVAPELVKEMTFRATKSGSTELGQEEVLDHTVEYLAIKDNEIKYLLINAIQDQQEIIEEIQKRMEELEDEVAELRKDNSTSSEDINTIEGVEGYALAQNSPNPHSGRTTVNYKVAEDVRSANLQVIDMNGIVVHNEVLSLDANQVELNLSNLASGMYVYSLVAGSKVVATNKMVIAK